MNQRLTETRESKIEPTRLTSIELDIIRAIGGGDAISTKQLADTLKISGNKLKARLKTLADSGFIRVKKARAYRNTTHFHFLTEKGMELCRRLKVPIEMKVYEGFHTQMKKFTIKIFGEEGWKPTDKKIGEDRYVDIALEKDGKRKLIEIETGSNSNEWIYGNIDKCVKAQAEIPDCDIHFLCASKSVKNRIIQQASKYASDNNTSFKMFVGDYISSMKNLFRKINWEEIEFTGDNNPTDDSNA